MRPLEFTFRAAAEPGWVSGVFVALVVLASLAAQASRRALDTGEELPPPRELYPQLLVQLGGIGVAAAFASRELALDVLGRPPPPARAWAWGAGALAAMLASAVLLWRVTPEAERARRAALLPTSGEERLMFAFVACAAGLAEELAWRAVLPAALAAWTGQAWVGIALAAASFAVGHALQGRAAMLVVFAMALAFQGLVEVADGLGVAVVTHALYDALVGLWLGPRLCRRA